MTPCRLLLILAALVVAGAAIAAKQAPPQVSPEGLQLRSSKDDRIVYVRPGASFGAYRKVLILDPYIEFRKNWQRDYNSSAPGLEARVRDEDMVRIKTELAKEFRSEFTKVLQEDGAYEVVEEEGEGVLVLRPAIVDLDVTAPDLQTANMTVIARSAGGMTLYLELWDAKTDQILARVMERDEDDGFAERATRSSNRAAAAHTLKGWATALRAHLEAARSLPAK
ncbi:hypothetical protein ASD72_03650 [Pseudoxanthomonas sp. Root630]|nr:hypothetical protein ASD72_03650 [Pseudoxanthomonas sp. Root630]